MRIFHWVVVVVFLSSNSAPAGKADSDYWQMTGTEKRQFHVEQGAATPHYFGTPGTVQNLCAQGLAMLGLVSKRLIKKTVESRSGYADELWRRLFGKAVHWDGPMAPGVVTLTKPIFDLEPGTYAATLRFSLATPYLPWVPGGGFRPGLLVILHRDGDKEDRGIFTMPPNGLTGFDKPVNPFAVNFVNLLELPSRATQFLAGLTFGRVVTNVYQQVVSADFGSLLLKPVGPWEQRYELTRNRLFSDRLAAMVAGPDAEAMFEIFGYDGKRATVEVGTVSLMGPFVESGHSNAWRVPHAGFTRK